MKSCVRHWPETGFEEIGSREACPGTACPRTGLLSRFIGFELTNSAFTDKVVYGLLNFARQPTNTDSIRNEGQSRDRP
jgi:hypothetical protein